jgi:hypothetical protein
MDFFGTFDIHVIGHSQKMNIGLFALHVMNEWILANPFFVRSQMDQERKVTGNSGTQCGKIQIKISSQGARQ